jgi:hypothetical protein
MLCLCGLLLNTVRKLTHNRSRKLTTFSKHWLIQWHVLCAFVSGIANRHNDGG